MQDKMIENLMRAERARQKNAINLIASENYVSDDVLAALGSEFTNKYAEGYPGKRYYGGNDVVDKLESLCQDRARKLFGLNESEWRVNVQPLSGSPANLAVYFALVPPEGKIMGMELSHGGHLTHGHKVSATGKLWKQVSYGVDKKTEQLDYDHLAKIAKKEKPNIIVAGFTAYPRTIDFEKFRKIADNARAYLMVDMSHIAGLVAGGVHPSPFSYADVVTTTTHKTLRGPRSAMVFIRKDKRSLDDLIDKAIFPGLQGGPHMNTIAAVAVALKEAKTMAFKKYARQTTANARVLAKELATYGWRIVSGGTDNHLLLVDVWQGGAGVGGAEASERLEKAGIIVNKNTIPFDTRSPADPSGIRLGTAAETTRGAKQKDMKHIARVIENTLRFKH
ncbi:MAG: serine hydroxymethyltransferase [Candidatus Yonathbacteria bacterium CG_4_10_14_3_um_filter_47_65]|uniref:Serine hydroxymethyltransferase n=1 Tax=Candidatus Yonathbacteria bacterium CG_4_9_14_0_8_um_filter_46_47 TaxID=1975106 RepID=A0A2M8D5B2_9BACT|nr:MAG: serine hydroxymethyltransferase [Candidatus Yonathbacteria bacterium CG23_combo_of_CG06-09_8_20_14_all_46_18]PIQ31432.1 MAG: serine hydroxymethyltransferase [Candidatus Yonathbacteria bacterium CG17_big_fil_post_rev_8_21_14_2_50_46_19]PIX56241.1 MAG: serine hydroxymethyltransferase [Candidatus Yonathbacteria bacterium CG_4_10_14_3_um_filter_47_65]PIY58008.1 MAG: serine hydroxymethyltransferase [Candidatus Yonathbacteria bacterium CG_4_10_14_0_8_um_filter_47_645]PJB81564.1 MAG: serine hy